MEEEIKQQSLEIWLCLIMYSGVSKFLVLCFFDECLDRMPTEFFCGSRRANGYFIYATVEGVSFQPRDVPIGPLEITLVGLESQAPI